MALFVLQENNKLTRRAPACPSSPKQAEQGGILFVLEDLGHAGALYGIVCFTGTQHFDSAELLRTLPNGQSGSPFCLLLRIWATPEVCAALLINFKGKQQFERAAALCPRCSKTNRNASLFCMFWMIEGIEGLSTALFV